MATCSPKPGSSSRREVMTAAMQESSGYSVLAQPPGEAAASVHGGSTADGLPQGGVLSDEANRAGPRRQDVQALDQCHADHRPNGCSRGVPSSASPQGRAEEPEGEALAQLGGWVVDGQQGVVEADVAGARLVECSGQPLPTVDVHLDVEGIPPRMRTCTALTGRSGRGRGAGTCAPGRTGRPLSVP
jgi:hypothetical protein